MDLATLWQNKRSTGGQANCPGINDQDGNKHNQLAKSPVGQRRRIRERQSEKISRGGVAFVCARGKISRFFAAGEVLLKQLTNYTLVGSI